ncbi:hypothetical protein CH373_12080 [Leptospira perolatii]|uniref:Uncharacterized protein n=1 Tax=Leptospira perolatii TaxID=2023191 RepID=A0A2M9ZL68_9LEPT|nr:hypothetical protein CH360_06890 [Leptospira perolatii]PJZ72797.1 hypothetical protein CH373_12080 [Leptospira perolatii]
MLPSEEFPKQNQLKSERNSFVIWNFLSNSKSWCKLGFLELIKIEIDSQGFERRTGFLPRSVL